MKRKSKMVLSAVLLTSIMLIVGNLAATAEEKITLRYMSWYSGPQGELEEDWLELWQARNPNIIVKKISPPAADLDYQTKLFAMIAGGRPPDVPALDTWNSQQFYKRGVCVDLEPLIARDGIDLNMLRDPFVEEGRSGYDGKLYGLPWGPGFVVTMFNKDIFDEAGLAYPERGFTYAELLALGKKLTKDFDGDGIIDQWGIKQVGRWFNLSHFVYQSGARYVDRETNKIGIAEPKFTSVMQFLADLDLKHRVAPSASEQVAMGGGRAEITGKFGIWFTLAGGAASTYKKIELRKKFDFGATYLPRPDKDTPVISFGKGNSIVMMRATKYPKEAWEFIKWTIGDEAQAYLAEQLMYPATKKAAQLPYFISPPGLSPNLLEPEAFPAEGLYHLPYDVPGWTDMLWKVFVPQSDLVWLGKKTAVEAMKEIEPEANRILAEAQKEAIEMRKVMEAMED